MSVDLSKLISRRKIELAELNGKTVAIDAYNVLYQFLSIIRQPDGSLLMDSKGRVTSHLSGLFYRTIDIIGYGIKPIYVFDGLPSALKQKTIEARMTRRNDAYKAWESAREAGNLEGARMHAQASSRVDKNIVESSKKLLDYMGVAYISAPSEGEGQASYMCKNGQVYAVGSQDYDTLLFGAKNVVRNLTFSGRRKLPKKNVYVNVEPELVNLDDTLNALGISNRQLVWIGIMLGTDFNDGIKGVGPKTALKIAKGAKSIDDIKAYIMQKYKQEFELPIEDVESLFLNPEVVDIDDKFIADARAIHPDVEGIVGFMCGEHEFLEDRIRKFANVLVDKSSKAKQSTIGTWF